MILGQHCNMLITHTRFINNSNTAHNTISEEPYLLWILNGILGAWNTNMSISHSDFVGNNVNSLVQWEYQVERLPSLTTVHLLIILEHG